MDLKSEKASFVMELIVVILLGITAVLTAYASWQASLYGGIQATNYAKSTSMIAEANSLYNEGNQYLSQDMAIWNQISDLRIDLYSAENLGDKVLAETLQYKLDTIMYNNVSAELAAAIEWADAQEMYTSPFEMEGFAASYYVTGSEKYAEGEKYMTDGEDANMQGDKLGLVTVVYSVVLFLLGIVGTFKNPKLKLVVTILSAVTLIVGTVFMLTIPMLAVG